MFATGCGTSAPPPPPKWFASCNIPLVGDVPVENNHGTRSLFREAAFISGLNFHEGSYADAARYGVTIRNGGSPGVGRRRAVTYHHVDKPSGRRSWELVFYGLPSKGLVRHEIGHVFALTHEPQGSSVMAPTVMAMDATWNPIQHGLMRQTVSRTGCNR